MDYRESGVDIEAGNEAVRRIRSIARATFTPGVLSDIGAFGGLFRLAEAGSLDDPVLVASAASPRAAPLTSSWYPGVAMPNSRVLAR